MKFVSVDRRIQGLRLDIVGRAPSQKHLSCNTVCHEGQKRLEEPIQTCVARFERH